MSDTEFPFPEPLPEVLGHVIHLNDDREAGDRWREASRSTAPGILGDSANIQNGDLQAIRSDVQTDYVELPLPFECDRCPRSFFRAKDLQWHKYKHAAELAFNCDKCEGMFPTNDDLEKHISTTCKKTGWEQHPEKFKPLSIPLRKQRYDLSASKRETKLHDSVELKTAPVHLNSVELDSDDGTRVQFRRKSLSSEESNRELSATSELVPVEIIRPERDDLTREAFETFEEMNSRHRRESDDLQRRIRLKQYAATDETRSEINRLCEDMERRLKKRQYMETPLLVDPNMRNIQRKKQLEADKLKEHAEHAAAISNIDSELQWMETEKGLLQTLEDKQKELGPDDISTIDTVKNTARVYFDQGKLVEAEHMYLRALNGYQNARGPTQMMINAVINNLGRIYYRQGNMTKAEEMYVQALANSERYLGTNHPTTRNTANRLGHVYQRQGKLQEAQNLFGESTTPAVDLSPSLVKNGAAGSNILQSYSKQRDNLTGTRTFTSNNIRDLGKAFRNIDDSHNVSSENQFDIVRWSTSEDASLLRTIARVGLEDWLAVSTVVGTKTAEQCHYRYLRFEKSFGIDPTSSDKSSQINFFMAAVEKNSSSELAHWLRDHRSTSEDGGDIVSKLDNGSAELKERSNEATSAPGCKSPISTKSFGDEEFTNWKNAMESKTLGIGIQSNSGTQRKSSSQLSAELGHDGYGYTKPMPKRTALEIAGLRAERRAEIERRCEELDPPLTKDLLASMPLYRTTIQDVRPLTELGWESLKQNFLAELAERTIAESKSSDLSNLPPIKISYSGSGSEDTDDMAAKRDIIANKQQKGGLLIDHGTTPSPEVFMDKYEQKLQIDYLKCMTRYQNMEIELLEAGEDTDNNKDLKELGEACDAAQKFYLIRNAELKNDQKLAIQLKKELEKLPGYYKNYVVPDRSHTTSSGLESRGEMTRATVDVNTNLLISQNKSLKVSDSVMAEQEEDMPQYTSENRLEDIVKPSQVQRSVEGHPAHQGHPEQSGPPPSECGQPLPQMQMPMRLRYESSHLMNLNTSKKQLLDVTIYRKLLTTYKVFSIIKVVPTEKERSTWAKAIVTEEALSQEDIVTQLEELDGKEALFPNQQRQVNKLLDRLKAEESDQYFDWSLVQFDRRERSSNKVKETVLITVIVKRSPRDEVNAIALFAIIDRQKQERLAHLTRPPTWTHTPEVPTKSETVDSRDIEQKLAETAYDLAESILEKSQWLGQMKGDELDLAITMLGKEVHSKLHGKGWPRTTLAMHLEVHIEAIRDLLTRHRSDQRLGSPNLSSLKLSEHDTNNDSSSRHPIEDIPDDQSDNSFEFSATDSVVSVADSVFSAMSLATGSSMSSLSVSQTATDRLVRLLLEDAVIKSLCEDALRENGMSRERFERNLSRLLKGFAVELRKEAQTREQRQAAHLVRFRARNSAHVICSTLQTKKEQKGSNNVSDSSAAALLKVEEEEMEGDLDIDDDSDSASESSEDSPDDFQHLELFVKDSNAFELFREKLRTFIRPQKVQLAIVSTLMVTSRRNSLSSKSHNWAIPLPEIFDDVKEQFAATPKDVAESRTQLMALNVFQQSSAHKRSEILRRVYQPIWQKLALFSNAISIWGRPPVALGKTRIEWRCKCGQRIYDDFTELRPGAANRFKQTLTNNDSGSTNTSRSSTFNDCSRSFSRSLSSIFTVWASNSSRKGLSSSLPTHEPSKNQLDSNNPNNVVPIPLPVENLYLLLCYPSGRYATRLLQLGLHNLEPKSDQSLFTILRTNYKSMRGRFLNLVSLKTLKSIKFVHFEMYRSSLIDVRQKDVIPPPDHIEYRYSPAPPEVIPPIGDNHLMHLFLHPDHADEDTVCLDRFPKKLKEKLSCRKGQPTNFGWGLEFVEGWDMKSIWIVAFVVFGIGSLLLGILWAVYKHSIQDAFTIAGYMVSFAAISVGAIQSLLVM